MVETLRLGDHCSKIGSGATPRGGKDTYLSDGTYKLIRSQNIYNDRFIHAGLACISDEQAEQLRNVEVQEGDVLLNITGDSVARACQVDKSVLPARVNQHVAIIRPYPDMIDAKFLRYFLVSPEMQGRMLSLAAAGATRNALTKGMIEDFRIPDITVNNQRDIASVLSALDEKIDLNRRTNETLETMARAIFKDWFVDFGPTRAKMEGRDPHLAPELWALFPDQLDDEGKPEGWRDVPLGEITKRITKGTTPTKSEVQEASPQNEQVNFLKVNTLSNEGEILWDRIEQIPKRVHLTVLKRSILEENDILYSIAGTIGRVSIVSSEILPANTNQALAIVRPDISQIPPYFLWMQLRKKENQRNLHANIVQAVQANLSLTMLSSARCVLPPPSSIFTIFCHIESLLKKREFNEKENRTLAQTRGLLLPKLMSGEIRVKDAEKLAGEAT